MENKNDFFHREEFYESGLIIFLLLNFLAMIVSAVRNVILHSIYNNPSLFCDHEWIYRELVYAMRGVDMSTAIAENIVFNDIGLVEISSTWPWAKILGIGVHGAFLPFEISKIYVCILYVIVLVVIGVFLNNGIIKYYHINKKQIKYVICITTLILISSWYYVYLVCTFNNGSFVCLMIIFALLLEKKHPFVAGILMAFAMIKAQIALPFFAVFLLRKKWKLISTSVSIVVTSWIGSCVLTKVLPWEQIANLLNGQVPSNAASYARYGMADFILLFDDSKILFTMLLSIIGGLLLLWIIEMKFMRDDIKERYIFVSYYPAAIVSLLWCYTTKCDYLILTVVALGAFEIWLVNNKTIKDTFFLMIIFGGTIMNLTNILAQLLVKIHLITDSFAQPLEGRLDTIVLLVMLIGLTIRMYKNTGSELERKHI